MKRLLLTLAVLMSMLAAAAQTKNYALKLDDFAELSVTDGINVVYHVMPDSAGYVTFTCDQPMADKLMFTSGKKRLKIQVAFDDSGPIPGLPTVHAYSSAIDKIENAGDSTLVVRLNGPQTKLKLRVVGNGTMIVHDIYANSVDAGISTGHGHLVLNGRAARLKIVNIGTGPIEAGGVDAKEVRCWAVGTGPIDCSPSESLTVLGAGSGKVYYKGKPEKITNRSIGVKTIPVD